MVMFSIYTEGKIPFKNVYLWGIVTDEHGKKMSKSKGNVLDPLELSDEYGTDALRLTAALTNTPGNDSPLGEAKVIPQRNFCNKLWNVAKFIESREGEGGEFILGSIADHWIADRFNERQKTLRDKMNQYRLNEAAYELYHFVWDDLADWYVESSKTTLNTALLRDILERTLALAHPFIPFISEEIWQEIFGKEGELLASNTDLYQKSPFKADKSLAERFEQVIEATRLIRSYKKELGASTGVSFIFDGDQQDVDLLAGLARADVQGGVGEKLNVVINTTTWAVLDEATTKQLQVKQQEAQQQLEQQIKQLEGRLANKGYVDKAPKHLVDETKQSLEDAKKELSALIGAA